MREAGSRATPWNGSVRFLLLRRKGVLALRHMNVKWMLFDLDGTLLPLHNEELFEQYIRGVIQRWAPVLPRTTPRELPAQVMAAVTAMFVNNDPARSNEEVFWAELGPRIGSSQAELRSVYDAFYKDYFPSLRSYYAPRLPGPGRAVVDAALAQGYRIALATNPIWPRVAIEERMAWVDLGGLPWGLVTCFEVMHACKPNPAYYHEVCRLLECRPEECVLIGNDVEEDGSAANVGMKVFMTTDYLINKKGRTLDPTRSGSLADLHALLKAGPLEL